MARAPVYGSGRWPAWMALVSNLNWRRPVGALSFGPCWPLVDWPSPVGWPRAPFGPCWSGMLWLPLLLPMTVPRSRPSPHPRWTRPYGHGCLGQSATHRGERRRIEQGQGVGGGQGTDGALSEIPVECAVDQDTAAFADQGPRIAIADLALILHLDQARTALLRRTEPAEVAFAVDLAWIEPPAVLPRELVQHGARIR